MYRGGYGDVWKGESRGRHVAVKVIRTYPNSDYRNIIRVSCWLHPVPSCCILTVFIEVLQGSCDVELPSAPKSLAADGGHGIGETVRSGV